MTTPSTGSSLVFLASGPTPRVVGRHSVVRPDDLAEAERIAAEGGEVRRLRPGSGTSRIFAPGLSWVLVVLVRAQVGAFGGWKDVV